MFYPYTSSDVTPRCRHCEVPTRHLATYETHDSEIFPGELQEGCIYLTVVYECPKCRGCDHTVVHRTADEYLRDHGYDPAEMGSKFAALAQKLLAEREE